jgi:hypothetical protein
MLVASVSGAAGQTSGSAPPPTPVAGHFRPGRLVGVYDEVSGSALDDVTVVNTFNGLSSKTTATGTLSLFFVDTAGALLRFQKLGYSPLTMVVSNSDADTVPITVMMQPSSLRLNPVITTAKGVRGPADTVRKLEVRGFYDRRQTSGAPATSFQTAEKLEGLTVISDAVRLTGRNMCPGKVFIDGVRANANGGVASFGRGRSPNQLNKNPVDQLVTPVAVEAIEMYSDSELPEEYRTRGNASASTLGRGPANCDYTTFIWTK